MNLAKFGAVVATLSLLGCSDTENNSQSDMGTDSGAVDMVADLPVLDMSQDDMDQEDMNLIPSGPYSAVSAGYRHSCLHRADETVLCFGLDNWGAASDAPADAFAQVSAGSFLSCGILRATNLITCWGELGRDKADFDPQQTYALVRAGESHSCAITTEGAIDCTGTDRNGTPSAAVEYAPSEGVFTDVTIGLHFSCALGESNTLTCWGDDTDNKVSDMPAGTFAQVVSGWHHSCARTEVGAVSCWGNADTIAGVPAGVFVDISAEQSSTCGVLDTGAVRCWGHDRPDVADAPQDLGYTQVDVGTLHSCALKEDGNVVCWGSDSEMQSSGTPVFPPPVVASTMAMIGNAVCTMQTNNTPLCFGGGMATARMSLLLDATEGSTYSVGYQHGCGIDAGGAIDCAGSFDGDGEVSGAPDGPFAEVGAGRYFNCARLETNAITCWGRDDGSVVSSAPTGTFDGLSVSARANVACAVSDMGAITCWGDDAESVVSGAPSATNFVNVDVGPEGDLACAVDDQGAVTCWGSDDSAAETQPSATYSRTAVGFNHVCGLATDGAVHCWGSSSLKTPEPPAGTTFADVMSDDDYSCGVTTLGDLWCFGSTHFTTHPESP